MDTASMDDLKVLAGERPLMAIKKIVQRHSGYRGTAIPILQDIQNTFGYVSLEMMQRAGEFSGIHVSELYSIATFYAQFRLEPAGENLVRVCHGTACHLAGAEKITESLQFETGAPAGGTGQDGLFTIEKVACIGCCSLAPVITINEETHGRLTPDKIKKIVRQYNKKSAVKEDSGGGREDA